MPGSRERYPKGWPTPLAATVGKPGTWTDQPLAAFQDKSGGWTVEPILLGMGWVVLVGGLGRRARPPEPRRLSARPRWPRRARLPRLPAGRPEDWSSTTTSSIRSGRWPWGCSSTNLAGVPRWLTPALLGEFFIKTGLVIFGAEVLVTRLLALGLPGLMTAWVVTPIVLVTTYLFGVHVLKIPSRSLCMTLSADMSVCGVSAAIATAGACRAKKEELSAHDRPVAVLHGDHDGGDAAGHSGHGARPARRRRLARGHDRRHRRRGRGRRDARQGGRRGGGDRQDDPELDDRPDRLRGGRLLGRLGRSRRSAARSGTLLGEAWRRFPRFILGFLAASLVCSWLHAQGPEQALWVEGATGGFTSKLRGWLFCAGFVCMGLQTNFRELAPVLASGRPVLLYVLGQSLNLALTLAMASLTFGWLFRKVVEP